MLPDAKIAAVDWENWIPTPEAIQIMEINYAQIYDAVRRYKISTYNVCGKTLYFKPDVEQAAAQIVEMREQIRARKQAA